MIKHSSSSQPKCQFVNSKTTACKNCSYHSVPIISQLWMPTKSSSLLWGNGSCQAAADFYSASCFITRSIPGCTANSCFIPCILFFIRAGVGKIRHKLTYLSAQLLFLCQFKLGRLEAYSRKRTGLRAICDGIQSYIKNQCVLFPTEWRKSNSVKKAGGNINHYSKTQWNYSTIFMQIWRLYSYTFWTTFFP